MANKKVFFITGFFLLVFSVSWVLKDTYNPSIKFEDTIVTYQVENLDNQDLPDRTEKEPVYMSIFKLIVNCNPFKQKKTQ